MRGVTFVMIAERALLSHEMRAVLIWIFVALAMPAYADDAATQTQQGAALNPEATALAHLDRGVALFRAGEFLRAHDELSTASSLAPDKPNPYRWLALTEIQLGDCARADVNIEGFLARVAHDDPRVAEMMRWRVLCRRQTSEGTEARTPPPRSASVLQRWWFWPAVGAVALAITGTVVYAATHSDETVLPAIHCTTTGCSP